jgi:chromosome partitioning protein
VLAFATQKGGMGKTTLSVLVASHLHYRRGIKVALLDVDSSQLSVYNQRIREIDELNGDEEMTARLDEQDIKPYEILSGTPRSVPSLLSKIGPDVELVLIDMPGNIDVDGYDLAIGKLDYLLVPMETSEYSVTTGFNFLTAIKQVKLLPVDRCRVVWNKYKASRDGELADQLEERFAEYGFKCLRSRVPSGIPTRIPSTARPCFQCPNVPAQQWIKRTAH